MEISKKSYIELLYGHFREVIKIAAVWTFHSRHKHSYSMDILQNSYI